MATYVVKAILHFPDGVNKGQTNITANDEDQARKLFIDKMISIWKIAKDKIDILDVRKR